MMPQIAANAMPGANIVPSPVANFGEFVLDASPRELDKVASGPVAFALTTLFDVPST